MKTLLYTRKIKGVMHILGVVFPILKGRQLRFHCSDRAWSFSTNRTSVTRITIAQIERKRDLITKTLEPSGLHPLVHRVELKFECKIGENLSYKKCFAGFP